MVKRHLARLAAPKSWNLLKKSSKYVTRPHPGAHSMAMGMPLSVILKDRLRLVKNLKEARLLLSRGAVIVDGNVRKDVKFFAGFMDVIEFPLTKDAYRLLLNTKGKIDLKKCPADEARKKISKVVGKRKAGKDSFQINTMDGRTFIMKDAKCSVGDSLLFSLPDQKLIETLKLEKKASVFLVSGSHIGETGVIQDIDGSRVIIKSQSNVVFETKKRFSFIIGTDKPAISCFKEDNLK